MPTVEVPLALSEIAVETLIDLVEIKLACLQVSDRDDAREHANLEQCLEELRGMAAPTGSATPVLELPRRVAGAAL